MKSYTSFKHNKGFTLAELLIVVAIIAILVAISIPIFTSRAEEARKATCEANRRSLKAELTNDYMGGKNFGTIDGITIADDGSFSLSEAILRTNYSKNFDFGTFCPEDDGTITAEFKNGSFTVYCSHHYKNNAYSFGDSDTVKTIFDVLNAVVTKPNSTLDSGAKSQDESMANKFVKALKKAGLDLDALGAKSWKYNNNTGFLYWTPEDIQGKEGTTLPVIRYNSKTGTYTVWTSTVTTGTNETDSSQTPYQKLDSFNEYKPSTTDKKHQTYEDALKYYQQALDEM